MVLLLQWKPNPYITTYLSGNVGSYIILAISYKEIISHVNTPEAQCTGLTYSRIPNRYESIEDKLKAEDLILWRFVLYTNKSGEIVSHYGLTP